MTSGPMDDARAVESAVRAAFASVTRGAITLHEAEVIDSYGTEAEREAARRLDSEHDWQDVSDADIVSCPNALTYLDPESWRFYLPAFMVWSLRHHREHRSHVCDATIYSLGASDEAASTRERSGRLDDAQARAVCGFLRYMAERDDDVDAAAARDALDARWGRYCEPAVKATE